MPERLMFDGVLGDLDEWFCNCPFVVENDILKRKWSFREWMQKKKEV